MTAGIYRLVVDGAPATVGLPRPPAELTDGQRRCAETWVRLWRTAVRR